MTPAVRYVARCNCGSVEVEMYGEPVISVVCHCDDCQAGARLLEALPGAPGVLDAGLGTPYVLYRNDRITCTKGAELLTDHRLKADSPTSRMVASCCNAAMLVRLADLLHWTPVYRDRLAEDAPPLEMRINAKFIPDGIELPDELPLSAGIPLKFIRRLIGARIAMALGR